ncbi:Glu/Leu/Phe/Val family dehydrogenase [Gluconobacter cerinus]|uniref:Glu/Leu/Phe/Val family dehydrogenase n=1 Tax=Gluconobacter cerinus TaxID=38307 RepID=UPI0039E76B63
MIYSGPVFDMARQQFKEVADQIGIAEEDRDRILLPKRTVAVSCPIRRDDGSMAVYQGYRSQHHLSLGPAKGGVRFSPHVEVGEVAALGVWMSWKCALAGLPYGGAKGGITVDPSTLSLRELEALSRRYMQELTPFVGPHVDVMAPDIGTNERIMAWFMDTYSVSAGRTVHEIVTGKPLACGGTEGRREATGRGVAHMAIRACDVLLIDPRHATAIIQGFGNVGSVAALELAQHGVKIIGLSDHTGAYYDKRGLPLDQMVQYAADTGSLIGFSTEAQIDASDLLTMPCDILVPAAVERVIDANVARKLQCRVISEGANGPTTPEADLVLAERPEIFIVPDIQCNSGGVIVSYFEWVQNLQGVSWGRDQVNEQLAKIMDHSFERVLARARDHKISNRIAANMLGVERVLEIRKARGLYP